MEFLSNIIAIRAQYCCARELCAFAFSISGKMNFYYNIIPILNIGFGNDPTLMRKSEKEGDRR